MKWHKVAPFNFDYCLATEQEMKDWFKKKKLPCPDIPDNSYGYTVKAGSFCFIVIDPAKNKQSWDAIGTIIHECVHIYQACMRWVGESATGIEMEAYTIETICVNLLKDYHALHSKQ